MQTRKHAHARTHVHAPTHAHTHTSQARTSARTQAKHARKQYAHARARTYARTHGHHTHAYAPCCLLHTGAPLQCLCHHPAATRHLPSHYHNDNFTTRVHHHTITLNHLPNYAAIHRPPRPRYHANTPHSSCSLPSSFRILVFFNTPSRSKEVSKDSVVSVS